MTAADTAMDWNTRTADELCPDHGKTHLWASKTPKSSLREAVATAETRIQLVLAFVQRQDIGKKVNDGPAFAAGAAATAE